MLPYLRVPIAQIGCPGANTLFTFPFRLFFEITRRTTPGFFRLVAETLQPLNETASKTLMHDDSIFKNPRLSLHSTLLCVRFLSN